MQMADNAGPDQTAHLRRLIRAFVVHLQNPWIPSMPGREVIKLFFMLNSAEHEIFSANKFENANKSWHFQIY